jgi:hypothetical protein
MREMGDASGVPIEPPQQKQLVDGCLAVTGVIAGGVPGGTYIFSAVTWPCHSLAS